MSYENENNRNVWKRVLKNIIIRWLNWKSTSPGLYKKYEWAFNPPLPAPHCNEFTFSSPGYQKLLHPLGPRKLLMNGCCWLVGWLGAGWILVIVSGDPTCTGLITEPELRRILTNQQFGLVGMSLTTWDPTQQVQEFLLTRGVSNFVDVPLITHFFIGPGQEMKRSTHQILDNIFPVIS